MCMIGLRLHIASHVPVGSNECSNRSALGDRYVAVACCLAPRLCHDSRTLFLIDLWIEEHAVLFSCATFSAIESCSYSRHCFALVSHQMFVLMSKEARANHVSEHYGRAVLQIWQETLVCRAP